MKKSIVRVLSCVGALMSVAATASAQDCPTCCHQSRDAYQCALNDPDPNETDFICSMENDVLEQDTCTIYPGLTFSEQPGKILRIDWSGFVRSGVPPVNAFVFGFTEDGDIACSLSISGFVAGTVKTESTNPGECAAADIWVYDANGG